MEVSLNLSFEHEEVGNIYMKQERYNEAEKWLLRSLQYSEPKEMAILNEERRKEHCLEHFMQRISIGNSLYLLFKKRKKTSKVVETIKTILNECEVSSHR